MNKQNTDRYEYRKLVAQVKFSLVAPVVSATFTDKPILGVFPRMRSIGPMVPEESFLL